MLACLRREGPDGIEAGAYDAQDRVEGYGSQTYTFDHAGYLTARSGGQGTDRFTYDSRGALRSASLAGGRAIDYEIDVMGRRVGKRVNQVVTARFLYLDGLRPVAQLNASNAVVSTFEYAERANVPSLMKQGTTLYRIVTDHLGSVRLVVNTATGAIVQQLDYDEFGRVLTDTNPGFQPFGFAGGLYDADTGLVRFGARDYDAYAGRWTARDPILFGGGDRNLYAYVDGDPVNRVDPSGLSDIFFFVDIDVAGGNVGAEDGYGIVIDTDDPMGSGFFTSSGPATGASFGVAGGAGWVARRCEVCGAKLD